MTKNLAFALRLTFLSSGLFLSQGLFAQSRTPHYIETPINTKPVRFGRAAINPDEREPIAYGLKASFSMSKLSGSGFVYDGSGYVPHTPKKMFLPGFTVGAMAEIPVTNQFYVQPELDFSALGSKLTDSAYSTTIKLNYINLPFLLKYKPFDGFSIFAGAQVSYLISSSYKSSYQGIAYSGSAGTDFKKFGFGYIAGIGYGLTPDFGVDLRYAGSLSSINNGLGSASQKLSSIQLGLRFFFF